MSNSQITETFTQLAQDTVQEYAVLGADLKEVLSQDDYLKALKMLNFSRERLTNRITAHYVHLSDAAVTEEKQ